MCFEYWNSSDGAWTWHLKTAIGHVVARGTPFPTRENCLSAIKLIKLAAGSPCRDPSAPVLEITAPAGQLAH